MCYKQPAPSAEDIFRLLANYFLFFRVTRLCLYFRRYWLMFKNPTGKLAQGPHPVKRVNIARATSILPLKVKSLPNNIS